MSALVRVRGSGSGKGQGYLWSALRLNRLGLEVRVRALRLERLGLEVRVRALRLKRLGLEVRVRALRLKRLGLEVRVRALRLSLSACSGRLLTTYYLLLTTYLEVILVGLQRHVRYLEHSSGERPLRLVRK